MTRLIVECPCHNSFVIHRSDVISSPGTAIVCNALLPGGERCKRQYLCKDLLTKMDEFIEIWNVAADYQAQLNLGQ